MGLTSVDRKELELLIKAAVQDPKVPLGLARRLVPGQGDIEEFAYGLSSGMVIGNFVAQFKSKNGRELDRDEIAEMFSIVMIKMQRIRLGIKKHVDMR